MRYQTELMRSILTSETAKKIIDYVSPIYGNSYVGLWIFQAIGAVLDDVCTVAEQLRNETNASTAELLLDYWERRYGIAVDSSLTVEQRRAQILAKTQSRGPCNPTRLANAISASLGGIKVEIEENVGRNKFQVYILDSVDTIDPAVKVIERMKPAHLIYDINVVVKTEANSEVTIATAITNAERFSLQVVEPSGEADVYIQDETLVLLSDEFSADGEALLLSVGSVAEDETLII